MNYPWIIKINSPSDPRDGIRVRHIESGNDGDVCNSIITYKLLHECTNPYVIDIGVDEGWWSFFVTTINPSATIDAFEPNPVSFRKLVPYLESTPQLRLHNYAISNICGGFLPFTSDGGQSHSRHSRDQGETVPCITLDRYIQTKTVDLIKIDTEGHDLRVLESLRPFIHQIKAIIFECTVYWYGTTREECVCATVLGLAYLKCQYKYIYSLSRRGKPQLAEIDDIASFVNWCYDNRYQTDILVCNTPMNL